MTTISDDLAEHMGEGYSAAYVDEQAGTIALHALEFFGIDPDLPAESWHAFMERHGHELREVEK